MTVIAYAQQDGGLHGIAAAIEGRWVQPGDHKFLVMRQRSVKVGNHGQSGGNSRVNIRIGRGLIRLQFPDERTGDTSNSPVVVAADIDDVRSDPELLIQNTLASVEAIGRRVDASLLRRVVMATANAQASPNRIRALQTRRRPLGSRSIRK